jgi:hypothetical protein
MLSSRIEYAINPPGSRRVPRLDGTMLPSRVDSVNTLAGSRRVPRPDGTTLLARTDSVDAPTGSAGLHDLMGRHYPVAQQLLVLGLVAVEPLGPMKLRPLQTVICGTWDMRWRRVLYVPSSTLRQIYASIRAL